MARRRIWQWLRKGQAEQGADGVKLSALGSGEMDEILARLRRVDLKVKRLVRESFAGEYQSSFKGQGLDFDDFREYQAGDEPRFIDWNVTARTGVPHVRQFHEERDLRVIFALDASPSMFYGSRHISKYRLGCEVMALLAFSAIKNGDKVGLLIFAEEPICYIPAAKGRRHGMRLLREALMVQPKGEQGGTELGGACEFMQQRLPRRSLIFLLSDFISDELDKPVGALARRHELVGLHLLDPAERELPDVGWVTLRDPETGWLTELNTGNGNVRMAFQKLSLRQREGTRAALQRHGVDYAELPTVGDYLPALHHLLRSRARRQLPH